MNWFSEIDGFDMGPQINPATSLPMLDGIGGVDVGGNPFGIDWSSHLGIESGSPFDPFGHGGSSGGAGLGIGGFSWD